MKTWKDLTDVEKEKVKNGEFESIMHTIIEAPELFPELEEWVRQAWEEADKMQTPWFIGSILYQDISGAKEMIDAIVLESCETAIYIESGEHSIKL
jgi:hypothetical protein